MKKLIPIFLIFLILSSFKIIIDQNEKEKNSLLNLKNCSELDYDNHDFNKVKDFSEIELDLIIDEERKWKKIILNTHLSEFENKSFTYDAKFTDATLRVRNKFGFDCILKAKIKPHGDLLDHYRDYGPGYDPLYVVPSLKVRLLEGNIFGIVEFRLLIPKTRNRGNEIFATTFFQEIGFYAPRTAYTTLTYNKKKYKFLFQEKLVKEFLETNSLQEGLFFAGDERFSFKYENKKIVDGKKIQEKEIGISKFRITESKFLKKNKIFIEPAINTLETLNAASHFYTSDLKQSSLIDYYSTQKNKIYENYFVNIPEFDALMYAVGAEHGLSRDDRRFYLDVVNKNLIPIYNDGDARILSNDTFSSPNLMSDISLKLNNSQKFSNSAKIGAPHVLKKLNQFSIDDFSEKLLLRGLQIPRDDIKSIISLIKKNLISLSNLNEDQIIFVSNKNQHTLKNEKAVKKNIQAAYIFVTKTGYKNCDLLLNFCSQIKLSEKKLRKALKQDLKDNNENDLIFLGDLNKFEKLENKEKLVFKNNNLFLSEKINIKIFGNIDVKINENDKKVKFLKKEPNSRVFFFNSELDNWNIEFEDLVTKNKNILSRDTNGLSGCINIYDSKVKKIRFIVNNAKCEDAINLVRTEGSINELTINNSSFDGIDADFSNLIIKNVKIINSGNDCMDFSYGNYVMNNIILQKCFDKAISTGEGSNLKVNKFIIKDSDIGIASKDSATVYSKNGSIEKVDKCLSLYKKKQEFNGGLLQYKNLNCQNFNDFAYKDTFSKLIKLN